MDIDLPGIDGKPAAVEPPAPKQTGIQRPRHGPAIAPSRSGRTRYFPTGFEDFLPSGHASMSPDSPNVPRSTTPLPEPSQSQSQSGVSEPYVYEMEPDKFGLYRCYTTHPTFDPERERELNDTCDAPGLLTEPDPNSPQWWSSFHPVFDAAQKNIYHPFLNVTVFRLMDWFYGSPSKSVAELDLLVNNVILAKGFDTNHLKGFRAKRELRRMEKDNQSPGFSRENGWVESSVNIPLPMEQHRSTSEDHAPTFKVSGIWHRSLLDIIKTALEDVSAKSYHLTPFKLFWKPENPASEPERVVTDLYNSDAFLEEHEKLQQQPREPECELERVIASVMVWSDSTHLTNFGQASLWPVYVFFGNQSKYSRSKPSQFAAHHLAYLPSVRSQFKTL